MRATREVRVTLIVAMNAMISNCMGGMGLCRDCFKDLSTKCNTADLFKLFSGLFFSFA